MTRHLIGRGLSVVALGLQVTGFALFLGGQAWAHLQGWGWAWTAGILVAATVVFAVASQVGAWAGRYLTIDVAAARRADPRPPVVYLRQFVADGVQDSMAAMWGYSSSLEEALVTAVSPVGPVIALNRPGERLPPAGAARTDATDDGWRGIIEGWLAEASLVLVLAATSEHVDWEMRRCVALVEPHKLVLVVPFDQDPTGREGWAAFRRHAGPLFPKGLPEDLGSSRMITFGPGFAPAWIPDVSGAFHPLKTERVGRWDVLFRRNLLPVFQAIGADVAPPPTMSTGFKVTVALTFLIFVPLILWISLMN